MRDRDSYLDSVLQRANKRDGAPPDYWQVYEDEAYTGPFEYPLISDWAYKSLGRPAPAARQALGQALRAIQWQVVFGLLAVFRDFWPLYVVGAAGNVLHLRRAWVLVVPEVSALAGDVGWRMPVVFPLKRKRPGVAGL